MEEEQGEDAVEVEEDKPVNSFWRPVLIEFVTVFFGVMGAFLVSDWQAEKKETQNKITYFESFIGELKYLQYQSSQLGSVLADIENDLNRNEGAIIEPNSNLRFKTNNYLILSAFQNENFTVIGSEYLNNLSGGSNVINEIKERVDRVRELSRDHYLKVEKTEEEVARFQRWYMHELQEIRVLLKQLNGIIEQGALPGTRSILKKLKK